MRVAVILSVAAVAACQGSDAVEVPPPVDAALTSLTAGLLHTCGLTASHHVYCWGWNRDGEIGDGSTTSRVYAMQVSGSLTFSMVSGGGAHSCGVSAATGGTHCWGLNLTGQLGDSSVISRSTPTAVTGGMSFTQVASGGTFTCGITATDSTAYCWGWGRDGELGSRPADTCPTSGGLEPCRRAPTPVGGGLRFLAISAGTRHACAIATDSAAYCWGHNVAGQLGNGTLADTALPVAVTGGHKFKLLTAGFSHTCGLTAAGDAYCWGDNSWGQLGETTTSQSPDPAAVTGGIIFLSLSAGAEHTCGIGTGNTATCWGQNVNGQLGTQSTETCTVGNVAGVCSHRPLPLTTNQIFASISAGGHHSCAITTGGKAYCWGENTNGQLGTGNTSGSDVPVLVANQP
jgi:alpha-tubulin suppressor-like RCC1 family protein